MTRQRSLSRRTASALVIALSATLAVGCSGGTGGAAGPVDVPKAREALKTALDGWKRGDKFDSFAKSSAISVGDMDWQAGAKLINYEVKGEGKEFGPNLNIPVDLTVRTPQGKEAKKSVSYVVGTSPVVTVFRALH